MPLLVSVPILANQAEPLVMITGMLAQVSTLLIIVGLPQRPLTAGNGGRGIGMPRLPSKDCSRAVSSPHTKAPAPSRISMSNEKSVPRILSPRRPYSRACLSAILRRSMASGYSARMYTKPLVDPTV